MDSDSGDEVTHFNSTQSKYTESANELQYKFANIFGFKSYVTWDSYEDTEFGKKALERKILLIIPDCEEKSDVAKKKIKNLRSMLVEVIWRQRKYNDGILLMSPIFVAFVRNFEPYRRNIEHAIETENFSVHPVFRIRKCVNHQDSSNCCMIFVDESGRVYQNWKSYKKHNVMQVGLIIAPERGIYMSDDNMVRLEVFYSPASNSRKKLTNAVDISSTVLGLGASTLMISALVFSVPSTVVLAAIGVCLVSNVYSVGRGINQVVDRSRHEQTLKLSNAAARSCWIGLVGGVFGLTAGVVGQGVAIWARSGRQISLYLARSVNVIKLSAMATNATGIVNGFLGVVVRKMNEEKVSSIEIVQLAASLFLFTHSVSNFKLATKIVNENNNYRDVISSDQKRVFGDIMKETNRLNPNANRADLVRGLRNIPTNKVQTSLHFDKADGKTASVQQSRSQVKVTEVIGTVNGSFKVHSKSDLENCIYNCIDTLRDEAFEKLMEIVKAFVVDHGEEVQSALNRVIYFEDFLSTAYTLFQATRLGDEDLITFVMAITMEEGIQLLLHYYYGMRPKCVRNKVCKKCDGKYYDL